VPAEPSPTARALRALEVLQTRPGATADELAARLGVTERAARRYVSILREAGIPVTSTRGPYGGYRLGRGMRLPPVSFTQPEALSLVMAVLDAEPAAADSDQIVGSALGKVIRALPEGVAQQAAALRAHTDHVPRRSARPDPTLTSALVAAVADRRRIEIGYRSESSQWQGEVEPWAVVVRHGRWYLLCRSLRSGAVRTYRVDRVQSVEPTAHAFVPPADLDAAAMLEQHLGTGWAYATRVLFDAPLEHVERWVRPPMGRLTADGEGCLLVGSTRNPTMYAQEWLAAVPFAFRVEGGPELRAAVATLHDRLAVSLGRPA